jgi:hypothetical protein
VFLSIIRKKTVKKAKKERTDWFSLFNTYLMFENVQASSDGGFVAAEYS